MVTPAGIAEIKTYEDGSGRGKLYIIPGRRAWIRAVPRGDCTESGLNLAPTSLYRPLRHKGRSIRYPFTFRDEAEHLTKL